MARNAQELQEAKARLERIVALARKELDEIEAELTLLSGGAKLDESFFWSHLYMVLSGMELGLASSDLHRILLMRGLKVPVESLRVFLHRQKVRGRLELKASKRGPGRWVLTAAALETAARLGFAQTDNKA